jgi:adenylosuccinate lyase
MMVALVQDLFFAARVESLAKTSGVPAQVTTSPKEFVRWVQEMAPSHVLLDLNMATDEILAVVASVPQVAGFGPHVQREQFLNARQRGIKTLWANSALPDRLPGWLSQG